MNTWGKIVLMLLDLVDLVDQVLKRDRAEKEAERVEEIRNNPAAEFTDKFSGLRDVPRGVSRSDANVKPDLPGERWIRTKRQ